MSKKEKDTRFVLAYQQSSFATETGILIDRETGVNYLFYQCASAGGLTPLLDREGRPVISSLSTLPPED